MATPYEILIRFSPDGTKVQGAHAKFLDAVTIGTQTFPAGLAVPLDLLDTGKAIDFGGVIGDALKTQLTAAAAAQAELDAARKTFSSIESALSNGADEEKIAAVSAVLQAAKMPVLQQKKQALLEQVAAMQAQADAL